MIKAENLDDMVAMLEENFSTALNNHTPEVTKVITLRKKKPWFGNELKLQKRKVWKREKVFRKYRLQSCRIAFDSERRKYRKMLMDAKIACYSAWVRDCRGDTKELYKLVNTLMGTTSNNPLPNHTNDKDLADEFADFYEQNLENQRQPHWKSCIPTYRKNISRLAKFRPFNQTEVRKVIFSMKTKSCELDTLPTKLLKECIDSILWTITNLVNISLWDGVFASRWKTAIIRSLLKKSNLDLIPSN